MPLVGGAMVRDGAVQVLSTSEELWAVVKGDRS